RPDRRPPRNARRDRDGEGRAAPRLREGGPHVGYSVRETPRALQDRPPARLGLASTWQDAPMKGVILAGGSGTRLHPLTTITNKHLLPIYDRPMVTYAIEALVKAGVTELMLVTGGTHAGEFFRLLGNGEEFGVDRLPYAYQDKPGGIAEALALAEHFVGGDRVVVLLADNIYGRTLKPCVDAFRNQKAGARVILSAEKDPEHLRNLGVAKFNGNGRIELIVEKPSDPPSR